MATFKLWLKVKHPEHFNYIEGLLEDEAKRIKACGELYAQSRSTFEERYKQGSLVNMFPWGDNAINGAKAWHSVNTEYLSKGKSMLDSELTGGNSMNYNSWKSKRLRSELRTRGMSGRRPADATKAEAISWLEYHDKNDCFPPESGIPSTPVAPTPQVITPEVVSTVVDNKPVEATKPVATPKPSVDSAKVDKLANVLEDILASQEVNASIDEDKVREIVRKEFVERGSVNITVTKPNGVVTEVGRQHKDFEKVLKLCSRPNRKVLLVGPAGSGKTTVVEKCAEALDLDFYPLSVGPQTTETKLLGYKDAMGNYHTTPVREAYEKGGILLLDEFDAGNPGVLTVLNSLLANHVCSFPDGIIKKHPEFRCVASANTYGMGANLVYVGRLKMDGATRDRFIRTTFGYDEGFERDLAGNDEWVSKVQRYRHHADTLGLRVVISPRASIEGALLLEDGFSQKEVAEMTIFEGLDADVVKKLKEVA